jgi:hypothetical protein
MAEPTVFCKYEAASFPESEFKHHPEFGLVHEQPPGDAPRHTTSGQLLPGEAGAESTWSLPSQAYR